MGIDDGNRKFKRICHDASSLNRGTVPDARLPSVLQTALISGIVLADGSVAMTGTLQTDSIASIAGNDFTLTATIPEATAGAQVGSNINFVASDAVAGTSIAGAAVGGSINFTAGNAARLTSGNAVGGSINFTSGNGVGYQLGGNVNFTTGDSGAVPGGSAGAFIFTGGDSISSSSNGGYFSFVGGLGTGDSSGGSFAVAGGRVLDGVSGSRTGGAISFSAGCVLNSSDENYLGCGGYLYLSGATLISEGNVVCGNATLSGGSSNGFFTNGNAIISGGSNGEGIVPGGDVIIYGGSAPTNGNIYIGAEHTTSIVIGYAQADISTAISMQSASIGIGNAGSPAAVIQIGASDTLIGFFGATPINRPTGVGLLAINIHAALVSLGLITA